MIRAPFVALALTFSLLPAQGPTLVPKVAPLISIRAVQVPKLVAQWPDTALGKLFADEDGRYAGQLGLRHTSNQIRRQVAVKMAFQQLEGGGETEPYVVANLYRLQESEIWRLLEFPVEEVQEVELTISADPENGMRTYPRVLRTMSCRPRYEGRWTQLFDEEAKTRSRSTLFDTVEDAKIDGFPAYAFAVPKAVMNDTPSSMLPPQQWMLHLPGRFVYGCGVPAEVGKVDAAPVRTEAEICLDMDLAVYTKLFEQRGRIDKEFQALGFDKLKRLKWSGRFVGELLYDILEVELNGEASGVVGAILGGSAELPAQALPKGALAQLRTAIDLKNVFEDLAKLDNAFEVPQPILEAVLAAFDGGIALSCCAPAPGGLIPRIYLTANLEDPAAFDKLLATILTEDAPLKKVTYGDVEVTSYKIPDAPQGLQPAWCVVDGRLHVAETARSMRAFLKAQKNDAVAMDVDGMEAPTGKGELQSNLDLRFDAAAIYENFYKHWLPLFELSGASRLPAPVRRADLPEPDVVAEYLGKGRGVLRRDGDIYQLVQASASGGLEATALLFTWSTMLSQDMRDYQVEQFSTAIGQRKLERAHTALEAFQKREQRRPKNLAELFTAERLADDALLLPGDDLAETIELPNGRTVRSSFRYFPEPVYYNHQGTQKAVMIEIRPHPYNRMLLCEDGAIPDVYGKDCSKPIDQFGKGGSGASSSAPERKGDFEYKLR